ncbi:Alpha-L-arabinofuranosidase II precursor [Acidisarcina polymorpha]|uniref:Alpha-L-arabinofuranosidase II n=1 Tax=Acidisarcina polymorpha TaxID=2211140 RepID=A0A2Z5G1B5_9BACT|nr:glycoside hydrolase family 43 protein [Acidisarcina polymorpha]AXC12973.1 Alpha-L-arabinofuranosidase II precursor [Acidisarcina polymorpha]
MRQAIFPFSRCSAILTVLLLTSICGGQSNAKTFTNPLLPSGADPWVLQWHDTYYYMNTTGQNLTIWKTADITDLAHAEKKVVWTPPLTGPYSHEIWAPELHRIQNRWYIYFAADAGTNASHRVWVLENKSEDPMAGTWQMKGKLSSPADHWAIDPSVFEVDGADYVVWSGWDTESNGVQRIFIARLLNPWTLGSKPTIISTPEFPWEKVGDILKSAQVESLPHVDVNEGPEILQHDRKIILIYSASGCWTDYYELGMITATAGSDLLDPSSWKKSSNPVFWQSPEASVYGPGHNTFFKSPDGKEDWILYHANSEPGQGCGRSRSPRAQRFTWNPDGTPDFGRPIATSQPLPKPSM